MENNLESISACRKTHYILSISSNREVLENSRIKVIRAKYTPIEENSDGKK